jgi:hypothetical protein
MMEKDLEKQSMAVDGMLALYRYLRDQGNPLAPLRALNDVAAWFDDVIRQQNDRVDNIEVSVIHPRQGMRKVSEAKVVKAIDLLSKEWLSMQQLANRVNLTKSSVATALMPAVRKRVNVSRQRMGKMAKTKYRVTQIG